MRGTGLEDSCHPPFSICLPLKHPAFPSPVAEGLPAHVTDNNSVLTQYPKRPVGVDLVERIWTKGKC